jgi:hypothetical protein
MIALLMQFPLSPTHGTLQALRAYIAGQSVPKYRQMEGLRLKIFLSDAAGETFGALYVFESEAALEAVLPQLGSSVRDSGNASRMQRFAVEAIVEGRHSTPDLTRVSEAMAGSHG